MLKTMLVIACLLLGAAPVLAELPLRLLTLDNNDADPALGYFDVNPLLTQVALGYRIISENEIELTAESTLPPGHELRGGRDGRLRPLTSLTWREPLREGRNEFALAVSGPLAAWVRAETFTVEKRGGDILAPAQRATFATLGRVIAWQWEQPSAPALAGLPVVPRGDTEGSGTYATRLIAAVRDLAAAAKVRPVSSFTPFILLPSGDAAPAPQQVAAAVVATAWKNHLPARLVLARDAQDADRWLVECYIPELAPGKWVLHDVQTGLPFVSSEPLSAMGLAQAAAIGGDFSVHCGTEAVTAEQFAAVYVAVENDFASDPRFLRPESALTLVRLQPEVEEYASLKRWSERLGIALFAIALLGIIGISLFGGKDDDDAASAAS